MKYISKIYMALIFLFLYAPLFIMVIFSFNASNSTSQFAGFSFRWYLELLNDSVTIDAFRNTMVLGITSSLLATILGTAAAVGIFSYRNRIARSVVMSVTNIPMMNPDIVTGISMMLLFVFIGKMLNSTNSLGFITLLIAHVTFNLPYVILSVMPKLRQTDPHLAEAARDLGCTPTKAFFKVIIPSISSGIVSGFVTSFTLSLDDFIISYFTSGSDFQTLPIRIFAMTKRRVTPDMYALSSLIFISVLILLILLNLNQIRSQKKKKGDFAK